jgi:hypothetical protein
MLKSSASVNSFSGWSTSIDARKTPKMFQSIFGRLLSEFLKEFSQE